MKKLFQFKLTLFAIISGLCFVGALSIGVPLLLGKIFWSSSNSLFVTQYIFLSYAAFFLVLLGILIPISRKILKYLKVTKINPSDGFATVLLLIASAIPLIILSLCTIFVFKIKKGPAYRYLYIAIFTALFLLGIMIRGHGKRERKTHVTILNHTSDIDYPITGIAMGYLPWNAVTGRNLSFNTNTFSDKVVKWLIGDLLKNYTIAIDRDEKDSRISGGRRSREEVRRGVSVAFYPEGGRTPYKMIKDNNVILRNFHDGAFNVAWGENVPIQPVVLDWPVIWHGKDDPRWGIHPCIVDIHYLPSLYPKDFDSIESFKKACWDSMNKVLEKSEKVKRFLNS